MRAVWAISAAAVLSCSNEIPQPVLEPDSSIRLDAGPTQTDLALTDAGLEQDAGAEDAGVSIDVGPRPIAREIPSGSCHCPSLPSSCWPPWVDVPMFAPQTSEIQFELVNLIACASTSIRAAVYQSQWPCLIEALQAKLQQTPELIVEWVVDDEECPRNASGDLSCALSRIDSHPSVTIVDDARSRLMHHKFLIVDETFVWTGSANLTEGAFCTDFNNVLVLEAPGVVRAFSEEFSRMFNARDFGPKVDTVPQISGPYTVHFSPQSPLAQPPTWHSELLEAIDAATVSIDFMIFAFTRVDIAEALVAARNRGVEVRGLIAPLFSTEAPAQLLLQEQVDLKTGPVHSKLMIIDEERVITGSPNWSNNAWANNEASLFIEDPAIAEAYTIEFERAYLP